MAKAARQLYNYAEYLALEETATEKHEYYRGEIYVMSGGLPAHSEIAINIATHLNNVIGEYPCHVYGSDLRVRIEAADYSTYADVMVICGELQYYQDRLDVVTNPLLMVEILSPSTRNFDQIQKFEFYRTLPSFEHYLVVDPERAYVHYYQRTGEAQWLLHLYQHLDQSVIMTLPHGQLELPLTQIYKKIVFPPPKPFKPPRKSRKGE